MQTTAWLRPGPTWYATPLSRRLTTHRTARPLSNSASLAGPGGPARAPGHAAGAILFAAQAGASGTLRHDALRCGGARDGGMLISVQDTAALHTRRHESWRGAAHKHTPAPRHACLRVHPQARAHARAHTQRWNTVNRAAELRHTPRNLLLTFAPPVTQWHVRLAPERRCAQHARLAALAALAQAGTVT